MNENIEYWRTNGWLNSKGNEVAHCKIFQEIDDLFNEFEDCEIVHVRRDSDRGIRAADAFGKLTSNKNFFLYKYLI